MKERDESQLPCPLAGEAEELFRSTVHYWRNWLARCAYAGRWREMVHRSALTLKLRLADKRSFPADRTRWLVEALTRAGRTSPRLLDEAHLLFERMLGYANHLGLYAEQTGPTGEALGNFPQAFTHLGLISAAFNLNRALEEHH